MRSAALARSMTLALSPSLLDGARSPSLSLSLFVCLCVCVYVCSFSIALVPFFLTHSLTFVAFYHQARTRRRSHPPPPMPHLLPRGARFPWKSPKTRAAPLASSQSSNMRCRYKAAPLPLPVCVVGFQAQTPSSCSPDRQGNDAAHRGRPRQRPRVVEGRARPTLGRRRRRAEVRFSYPLPPLVHPSPASTLRPFRFIAHRASLQPLPNDQGGGRPLGCSPNATCIASSGRPA